MDSSGGIIMAVKSWQLGYDAATGNFVELDDIASADPSDPRVVAFENQITAIMEQKGLLASQAQQYIANAYNAGSTLEAFTEHRTSTATAEERGDVWGASDDSSGRSFLTAQESSTQAATGDWQENARLISSLYTEGFGREADTDGLHYWTQQLHNGTQTYAQIAQSFGLSDEAQIRDVYHQEYGRDADDSGLQYWMSQGSGGVASATATIQSSDTLETQLRQEYADTLGQFSNEGDRQANIAAGGIWTDVQEGGYANLDWRSYNNTGQTGVQSEFGDLTYDFGHRSDTPWHDDFNVATGTTQADHSAGDQLTGLAQFHDAISNPGTVTSSYTGGQIQTLDDVRDILGRREDIMNTTSTYDRDDMEGGSGIGRIFTLEEMEPWLNQSTDLNDLATKLGAEKWAILTKELTKTPGEDGPITGPPIHDPGTNPDVRDTNRNTLSNDYQVPVPDDYSSNPTANVTRQDVNYMPGFDGTVPNRPLRNLDSSYTTAPQQAVRNQGAFVAGTSAQGVRRRQSSAARSGRSSMGTKQLARNNMQIKSLNI